jgi:hypothetical protein
MRNHFKKKLKSGGKGQSLTEPYKDVVRMLYRTCMGNCMRTGTEQPSASGPFLVLQMHATQHMQETFSLDGHPSCTLLVHHLTHLHKQTGTQATHLTATN